MKKLFKWCCYAAGAYAIYFALVIVLGLAQYFVSGDYSRDKTQASERDAGARGLASEH